MGDNQEISLKEELKNCHICPRNCGINRLMNNGICRVTGEDVYIARASLHFWEEPCISGENGSGTVFFSGCSLRCIYCQNKEISFDGIGKAVTIEHLSEIFLKLQEKNAHNINLVTPTHYSEHIRKALLLSEKRGLSIPVVYNCGGYEDPEILKKLEGLVDIYLTDFKYMDRDLSKHLSGCNDYPEIAEAALKEMVRQQPECIFDSEGMLKKGVIVRHLLLPGHVRNSEKVVEYLYNTYGNRIYISLMNQYTPMDTFPEYPYLNRKVTKREYEKLIRFSLDLGVEQAFIQEGKTAEESFIPPFDFEGVE